MIPVKRKPKLSSKKITNIALARMQKGTIEKEIRRKRIILIFGFIGLTVLYFILNRLNDFTPHLSTSEPPLVIEGADGSRTVQIPMNLHGQFVFTGHINGKPVIFLVDTGANGVVIPPKTANYLGLKRARKRYARTAGGLTPIYSTSLDLIDIGVLKDFRVPADSSDKMSEDYILLGMTVLQHVKVVQENGMMQLISS